MTDDKPDALELLKRVSVCVGFVTPESAPSAERDIRECIAAWEKERAEWKADVDLGASRHDELLALRVAVEKESARLRQDAERVSRDYGHHGAAALMIHSADALDAALWLHTV